MPEYLSPGVYVEEVPPSARPIAGVGTSTAGFIGVGPPLEVEEVNDQLIDIGDGIKKEFDLPHTQVIVKPGFQARVDREEADATLVAGAKEFTWKVKFDAAPGIGTRITADYTIARINPEAPTARLCTNFSEFVTFFGDFSSELNHQNLAHGVFGFFNNGGTRCFVVKISDMALINKALTTLEAIDEIAIVAFPGNTDPAVQGAIIDHCEKLGDRFAVLDGPEEATEFTVEAIQGTVRDSTYTALYFPWIKVFDTVEKLTNPAGDGTILVAPSGHVAGVYARVDSERGVHKAPANEIVRGALGLKYQLTKAQQDGLNPDGINVIRSFSGNIKIWGARTLGGDDNGEFKYVSTRRFFNFLRESIDEGTQFVVFEPNTPALWERIKRSVGDFLLAQWRAGALFGVTPKQAFFVRCDESTNPPDVREAGQVVTEIGVAIVKPAEFVIFRIQQITGG